MTIVYRQRNEISLRASLVWLNHLRIVCMRHPNPIQTDKVDVVNSFMNARNLKLRYTIHSRILLFHHFIYTTLPPRYRGLKTSSRRCMAARPSPTSEAACRRSTIITNFSRSRWGTTPQRISNAYSAVWGFGLRGNLSCDCIPDDCPRQRFALHIARQPHSFRLCNNSSNNSRRSRYLTAATT